jgi:MFS family permease
MLRLIRAEWRLLLFGFLMTFWSAPGQTFLISLFSGEIRAALNLSDGEFAALYSLATLASAVVVIWSGALVDRIDLKKLSLWVVCGLAAGCGLMSISHSIPMLLISLFLLRQLGQGLMFIISSTTMVRYIDEHKGKASALAGIGYAVSEAVMPGLLVALLLWVGWRQSWQVAGALLLLFMIPAIVYLLRDHRARHTSWLARLDDKHAYNAGSSRRRQWTRAEVIRDRYFYLFAPGLMSQPLMFTGFIFHQVHLVESRGWPLLGWATLFSLYAIVSVGTKLICGPLIDRLGAIRMIPLVALPMGVGLVILALAQQLWWGGVFLVLTGVTVGFQSTAVAPFWAEMYGSRHLGAIKSLGAAAMVFCTAVSPVIIGWQIDLGVSMETLALAAAIYIFLTSALAWYAGRSHARHHAAALRSAG